MSTNPRQADGSLLANLYPQLRQMAARHMMTEPAQTLQPTALVHEAWLRISGSATTSRWGNAAHMLSAVSRMMKNILVDRARSRAAQKRGGAWVRMPLEAADAVSVCTDEKMLLVHEALLKLEEKNPLFAEIVNLSIFMGLSNSEIAAETGVNERSVYRYLSHAKALLYDEILSLR